MGIADIVVIILGILISALTVIEKWEKIKWRPLSWLFGSSKTQEQIEQLTKTIGQLSCDLIESNNVEREHYKKQAKMFISDFAKDLRDAIKEGKDLLEVKSKGQYVAIIDLCNEYLDKGWNSEVQHDAQFIKNQFNKLADKM